MTESCSVDIDRQALSGKDCGHESCQKRTWSFPLFIDKSLSFAAILIYLQLNVIIAQLQRKVKQ